MEVDTTCVPYINNDTFRGYYSKKVQETQIRQFFSVKSQ